MARTNRRTEILDDDPEVVSRPRVRPRRDTIIEPSILDIVEPPPEPKGLTTGQAMMKIRNLAKLKSGVPWNTVIRLRPLNDEDPTAPFQAYARLKDNSTEWQGEYAPDDCDDETIETIVSEVLLMREQNYAPVASQAISINEDGETTDSSLVGKKRKLTLANGSIIEVNVHSTPPLETESSERARVQKEVDGFPIVVIMVDREDSVGWNGQIYNLTPGPNPVPKPAADIYFQAMQATKAAHVRMNLGMESNQAMAWISAQRRGV